ncbi:MAG: protein kinase [Trebonia sp.]|uniref:serine/threonine-protein kinase n=5 Tax=Trebonia sp. TaxID=2767075 RepID=UPI003C70CF97
MVKELQPGDPQVIGPYRMVGRLGQGGMGQVFLGVSPGGRPVAVKAIRPDLASDPQFRIRFAREVAAARTVSGVFTAMVVGADVDGPIAWLATAYVPGPSLAEAVNEHGPLPEASLLALAAGLAEALAAIHAAGVTHRDLKPSNVLLAEDGPRVIDFGISRAAESTTLTQTGLTIGSPGFMSPEQAIGTEVGPPSDVFSLGTVLAFAATGKGPFGGGTTASLLYRVVHETPDLDGVPAAVRPLIERCLVKDPAQRPTAVALLDAVGALQPAGNWLPDSVIRMAAAPPSLTPPPGQPAPTAVDGTPAPTPVPLPLVPGFAPTQTSMADFAAAPPYQATEAWSTPASGSPPLAPGDPPSGTGGPRRRSRPLVLAAVIGVLVLGGAGAAFALSSRGHTPTQSRPAANVSPVTAATKSASASASPSASKHPTASASASSHATTTQPTTAPPTTAPPTTAPPTTAPPTTAPPTTAPPTTAPPTTAPPTTAPPTTAPPTTAPPTTAPPTTAAPTTAAPTTASSAPSTSAVAS